MRRDADRAAEVRVDDPGWGLVVAEIPALCDEVLAAVSASLDGFAGRVGFLFADDAALRKLNATYRGWDNPTNVLSFPADQAGFPPGEPLFLGDIALARETVIAEAVEQGKSAQEHTAHMIVHGILHLLGYDHSEPTAAAKMEALERTILARLGIADPYVLALREPT